MLVGTRRLFLCSLTLLLGVSACAPRKTVRAKTPGAPETAQEPQETDMAVAPDVESSEASIRGSEFAHARELLAVPFHYDAYSLTEAARETLKGNAEYLKANPDLEVLVAGHCDQRGTVEYNLALGQRRAKAVREYYLRLGLPGKSVATISYGKENTLCADSSDDCWSRNRRAETRVRARTASNRHAPRNLNP